MASISSQQTGGSWAEANDVILQAISIDPYNYRSWSLLGELQYKRGNYDDAIKTFEKSYDLNPTDGLIVQYLILCYRKKGRIDLALKWESIIKSLGWSFD